MPLPDRRAVRAAAFTLAAALSISGLVVIAAQPAVAVPGAVTGTVFQDYNSNGVFDTGNPPTGGIPDDRPLPGVTVSAYDAANTLLGQTTSGADGTYALAALGADGSPVRIEFTDLPAGWFGSFHGEGAIANGTSVQFAAIGDEGVDFGANVPEEHNQGDPFLAIAVQSQGDPANEEVGARPSVAIFPFSYPPDSPPDAPALDVVPVATQEQTGAVWGTAFDRVHRSLFVSAVYKRQSGLGPLGLGGIYRLPDIVDGSGQYVGPTLVEPWLDVQGMPVQGGGTVDLGTALTNAERGLAGPLVPSHDPDAYEKAGKLGILGIAVSADGSTLYFVNGFDRQVYALDISDPGVLPAEAVRIDLDLDEGQRPWAIETRNGQLYVGYVDTGEDLQPGSTAETLSFAVVATPEAAPGTWTEVLSGPLGYGREPGDWFAAAPQTFRWNAWVDDWSWPEFNGVSSVVSIRPSGPYRMQVFPQAILSDITFDRDGYLVVSLMDRVGMQGGLRNYPSDTLDESVYYIARALGEILLAAPDGAGWVLESNGSVGDRVSAQGVGTDAGPGGGEFVFDSAPAAINDEWEMAFGAAAVPPGMLQAAVVGADPTQLQSNGVQWFGLGDGDPIGDYGRYITGTFSKAPGIGAIDDLALAAPVQIGNRVWFDADRNGRQDADEPPVEGVTVELRNAADVTIATTVTDAQGEYYFSSNDPEIDGFQPGGEYSLAFITPAVGDLFAADPVFGTVPWDAVDFTTQFAADATPTTDSNPDPVTGVTPAFTLGGAGQNDHAFDAGLIADAWLEVIKAIDPDGEPAEPGQSFEIVVTATDFRGNPYDAPGLTFDVLAGGSATIALPVGTVVTVSESPDGSVESFTVDPAGPFLVGGTEESPTIATVSNLLRDVADISLSKIVTGDGEGSVGGDYEFTVEYEWVLGEDSGTGSVTLNRDTSALIEAIPVGAVLTLSEAASVPPPGVAWGTPVWSGDGVVDNGDGTATVTVTDDAEIEVELGNVAQELPEGSFTLQKALDGPAGLVDPTTEFVVEYRLNGLEQPDLVITPANGTTVTGLEVGDVVVLEEVALPDLPGVDWGEPTWTIGGDPVAGEVTFEITEEAPTFALMVTNHFEGVYGSFSITKALTGIEPGQLPIGAEFTGTYDYPGRPGGPGTFSVGVGQTWMAPIDELILEGTEVTISELMPTVTLPSGYVWRTPVFTGSGVTDEGDGVARITIGDDTLVEVGLTNVVAPDLPVTGTALAPVIGIGALLLLGAGGILLALRRARSRGATG